MRVKNTRKRSHAMSLVSTERRVTSLSAEAPGPTEFRIAWVIGVVTVAALVGLAPFAGARLPHFTAFTPAYEAWSILCALITTLLLLGQVAIVRSNAILVLALGYLFTALTTTLQFLTFPGNFSPTGLFGAGPGTSDWLFLVRGAVLPACVIAYAAMGGASTKSVEDAARELGPPGRQTSIIVGAAALLVVGWGALPLIVLAAEALGPMISTATGYTALFKAFNQIVGLLGVLALGAMVARRFKTRFDLWIFVTMLAWFAEITLTGLLSGGRYDLGWYGGHAFGAAASSALMVALLFESANHFRQLAEVHEALVLSNRSLEHLSLHDGLTGLANRRYFDSYLSRQASLMRRHRRDLALVLCDLDNFKAYNDHYGHQAGDECLARIAVALQTCCRRPGDLAARYGGEEFAIILPETDLAGAVRIAETAREAVARLQIVNARSTSGPIMTLSGGVAVLEGASESNLDTLVSAADAALFEAKRLGRNRIISATAELSGS
jgi:diguanylate cyclase (GGDEF)-like protein